MKFLLIEKRKLLSRLLERQILNRIKINRLKYKANSFCIQKFSNQNKIKKSRSFMINKMYYVRTGTKKTTMVLILI